MRMGAARGNHCKLKVAGCKLEVQSVLVGLVLQCYSGAKGVRDDVLRLQQAKLPSAPGLQGPDRSVEARRTEKAVAVQVADAPGRDWFQSWYRGISWGVEVEEKETRSEENTPELQPHSFISYAV